MATPGHNTYGPGYAATQVKHHEWRTAENSAAHLLPKLKALAEQNPHVKLLDVGAGSGTISASLAKYIPGGQVLATDISDEILSRAKEHAESKEVSNIAFQPANVYKLPFPDSHFDVAHASQVLCHLDSPRDAIKEMVRVTKPGGVIALRETDMQMWCIWPEVPALLQFHDVSSKTIVANGGQDKGGRRLLSWTMEAGIPRDHITVSYGTWCYSSPEDKQAWASAMAERMRNGQMREKALELGIATEKELDQMADAWEEWEKTADASLGIMNGELIIEKP